MYNGSQHMPSESYVVPGTGSGQQLLFTPTFLDVGSMGSEVPLDFIVDQGLYYSAAPSYYAYCSGLDSTMESDDCPRFLGLDGQDLQCSEIQAESLPYMYCTSNYGFAHPPYIPYNPYDPYIPGAITGVDSQFVWAHQYFNNAEYQQHVSSPAYFPIVVNSGTDVIPNDAPEPLVFNSVGSGSREVDPMDVKFRPLVSVSAAPRLSSHSVTESPVVSRLAFHAREAARPTLAREAVRSVQASDQQQVNVTSVPSSSNFPVYTGSTNFGPDICGAFPAGIDPGFASSNSGNGSLNMLGEQNRGPRMDVSKCPNMPLVVKGYTEVGAYNAQGNIIINHDQYNRADFSVNYPDAKFFVIKSYSEDDVHKSIKYGVWSSTPSGNKRLDCAYDDAQRISVGDSRKCPVFLFFSVNASGQFCGVAEMIGPVDFNRNMDFWQHDKWTGSFPVKWHIIKDVSNTSLRHIILENNENKPVTNSRDTQEVKYMPGTSMLAIFKNSPPNTSIMDDFSFYEERQKIMYEGKYGFTGISNGNSLLLPSVAPPSRPTVTIKHPARIEENQARTRENPKRFAAANDRINAKLEHGSEANNRGAALSAAAVDGGVLSSVAEAGSLSLGSDTSGNDHPASPAAAAAASCEAVEYVTVGSLPVKVNGYDDTFVTGASTDETAPVRPKSTK